MKRTSSRVKLLSIVALLGLVIALGATFTPSSAQTAAPAAAAGAVDPAIAKIRDEGMNRSPVMQTLSYLTDVIGPRLTGSSGMKRANEWTRDKLTSYGLVNGRLEPWQFGRGWTIKRFSAQIIEPVSMSLIALPKCWSPGLDKVATADVLYLNARTEAELKTFEGKLRGAIVVTGTLRPVAMHLQPQGRRYTDEELAQMASDATGGRGGRGGPATQPGRRGQFAGGPATQRGGRGGAAGGLPAGRVIAFLMQEGALMEVSCSSSGDGGSIATTAQATLPTAADAAAGAGGRGGARGGARAYSMNAPATLPQVLLAVEDYNRLVRMLQFGEKPRMVVDFQAQFDMDPNSYNTIVEIPGTDLKDEIVMLGGHLDSWDGGTGATDNASGCAISMEAVRIIKALGLQPRRTIRIALWSGEEQGLLGSAAYVRQHFGSGSAAGGGGRGGRGGAAAADGAATRPSVVRLPEYEKLSVYFNYDNGGGKIRGIYAQGNPAAGEVFKKWLVPLAKLGATTVTLRNTGSTDHASFDNIGLPGFQFIQDPLEYNTRTHHFTSDVYDRIPPDDMKQSAVIMATFVYNAAMADQKIPRKPGN